MYTTSINRSRYNLAKYIPIQLVITEVLRWTKRWPTCQKSHCVVGLCRGVLEGMESICSPGMWVRDKLTEFLLCSFVFHSSCHLTSLKITLYTVQRRISMILL